MVTPARTSDGLSALENTFGAPNYHPLPVVAASAAGAWITDVNGKHYLDFLSAYSALNFGHRHPALIAAAHKALDTLTLTSRAMRNDQLGPFLSDLCAATGMEMALPMNTGAEAVETAVKTARKWGYEVKGVRPGPSQGRGVLEQLPWPHDHHRQLLDRRLGAQRVRAVHARLPAWSSTAMPTHSPSA